MKTLDLIFLILLSIVFYTYIGYGILLWLLVKIKKFFITSQLNPQSSDFFPSVTLVVAAWNEEQFIEKKIVNSLELDYPKDKITFLFVSDGSDDKTPEIIAEYKEVKLLHQQIRKGKTAAVNRAMLNVNSEITIFSDANTMLNKDAIKEIVKHFSNNNCGCVSGEKRVLMTGNVQAAAAGEGLYWKYESKLKKWDAELYSAAGAAGELFAIRTELYTEVEEDTILDDFMISLRIVEKGYTIAYEPNAYALETASADIHEEIKRKVRICAGGFQSIQRLTSLLNVFKYGIFTFQFISHRLLRWTITPIALFLLLPVNLIAASNGNLLYIILFILQMLFYGMAFLGWKNEKQNTRIKILFVPFYFVLMNVSVFAGFIRFYKGNQSQMWQRAQRATN
jgi:cellulose synthase/poly-beta-1,6-N-acetylglucosamine synthase-like glycosyltransferase